MLSDARSLIVIPTYNERRNISDLVERILNTGLPVDLLFVDDSSDGTATEIERCSALCKDRATTIQMLRRGAKKGLGSAYIAGFRWALKRNYQYIVQMDADLSHDPVYLPPLLATLQKADFVVGSRYVASGGVRNWNPIRRLISRMGCWYANAILGWQIRDFTGGYNAWQKKVLQSIDLEHIHTNGYAFQIEMKYRALKKGFDVKELPIIFCERQTGKSKMSSMIVLEAIFKVWRLKFSIN